MREYAAILGIAIGVTYLLASIARLVAVRLGAQARVRARDVHAIPIPYFGGPAMLGGLFAALLVAERMPFLGAADPTVFRDVRAILFGGAIICVVGVIDDLLELDALTKFAGQVLAAVTVVALGVQFIYLPLPGTFIGLDQVQAMLLTVFLVVGTANAVNFVDGLDGLAAGIVAIGAVAFFVFAFVLAVENGETRAMAAAMLMISLAGVCVGILPHNFYPAKMFIGDSGSMLIGFVMACGSISLTGQFPPSSLAQGIGEADASFLPTLLPVILPFMVLAIPFVDMLLAVVRRTRDGRSPFSPDKAHLHHRLLQMGHSHPQAVLSMYAVAGLVAFGSVVSSLLSGWELLVSVVTLCVLTAVAIVLAPKVSSRLGP
ncbi:MAG: MraY family glycosyltransferase [Aeromicrobium sp.]|uniref:MraY family glycosyltransferase n=1 Tax=Aeromicrobium sp. TaxID=1871063 RepID=UPI0039E56FEB